MANINKIRVSGTTYDIQDSNASKTVELTQAQYDALTTKDPNTYYIITDAQAGDLTNYYTKSEANTLLGYKADTATTYTKTEVDNTINAVKRDAVTINAFEESTNTNLIGFSLANVDGTLTSGCNVAWVGDGLVKTYTRYLKVNFTSGLTSASTETQVPSAKVVYDELQNKQNTLSAGTGIDITNDVISVTGKVDTTAFTAHTADTTVHTTAAEKTSWNGAVTALGGLSLVKLSQSEYDALATKDNSTLYVIVN